MSVTSTFQWSRIDRVVVQRPSPPFDRSVPKPVEIFPKSSRSGFPQVPETDRIKIGIPARIHPGIVTGLISEC
jgi:hypothetical protein